MRVRANRYGLLLWAKRTAVGGLCGALTYAVLRLVWFGLGWVSLFGWGWSAAQRAIIGGVMRIGLGAVGRHAWLVGAGGAVIAAAAAVVVYFFSMPHELQVAQDRATFMSITLRAFGFELAASALTCIVILMVTSAGSEATSRRTSVDERESVRTTG